MSTSYDIAVKYIKQKIPSISPIIGIYCGSGLKTLEDLIDKENSIKIYYKDIPGFPSSIIEGHGNYLIYGKSNNKKHSYNVIIFTGRFHFYEGYSMDLITLPIRVMKKLGVKILITTSATGGIDTKFNAGDIAIITDHFSLPSLGGFNPLVGHNDASLGPRFISTSDAYCDRLQDIYYDAALTFGNQDIVHKDSTYCHHIGPSYESLTEVKFFRKVGGSVAGMSSVPETIAAHHMGLKILALSIVACKSELEMKELKEKAIKEALERGEDISNLNLNYELTHEEVLNCMESASISVKNHLKYMLNSDEFNQYVEELRLRNSKFPKYMLNSISIGLILYGFSKIFS